MIFSHPISPTLSPGPCWLVFVGLFPGKDFPQVDSDSPCHQSFLATINFAPLLPESSTLPLWGASSSRAQWFQVLVLIATPLRQNLPGLLSLGRFQAHRTGKLWYAQNIQSTPQRVWPSPNRHASSSFKVVAVVGFSLPRRGEMHLHTTRMFRYTVEVDRLVKRLFQA